MHVYCGYISRNASGAKESFNRPQNARSGARCISPLQRSMTYCVVFSRSLSIVKQPHQAKWGSDRILEITNPRALLSRTETKGKLFSCLGELCWYLAKTNELSFIAHYLSHYREESDDGHTVYGAVRSSTIQHEERNDQVSNVIYMQGATGPYQGALLLFGENSRPKLSQSELEAWLVRLEAHLDLYFGMQVLEDALCNWQKSPRKFKPFRG